MAQRNDDPAVFSQKNNAIIMDNILTCNCMKTVKNIN